MGGGGPPCPYPRQRRRVCAWRRRVGWRGLVCFCVADRPPEAGAATAAVAGGSPLARISAAGGAVDDAAPDAERSVSPPCVAERPQSDHGRGRGRTRSRHVRQCARRWRRARGLA